MPDRPVPAEAKRRSFRVSTAAAFDTTADWRRTIPDEARARYRAEGLWRDRTPFDDFLDAAARNPHKAAIVTYSKDRAMPTTVTYGQLTSLIDRFAGALYSLGVREGDIVSIQLPNTWEFPALALACMRLRALPNPIPHIYREKELRYMLRHAESKVYIVRDQFKGFSYTAMARSLQQDIPTLEHVVILGDAEEFVDFDDVFVRQRWDLDAMTMAAVKAAKPGPDDPAMLLYTSGTTGHPKAAIHSQNTLWSAGRPIAEAAEITEDDVSFNASTVGHLTGFYWGTYLPLSFGQKVVYQEEWDPRGLIDIIDVERISWMVSATPFALDMIAAQKEAPRPLASMRAFVCGGAPIPPHVAVQMQEHLKVDLLSLWGMSEVGVCSIHRFGTPLEILASSDGAPVEFMQLRIVDEDDRPVADGDEGRLQVRGPSIILGYYKQPEATKAAETADGWFDTGDLGRRTPEGGIRVTGRAKDIILRGGQNVPVVEIENALLLHPKVDQVAVVAYPDDRMGERACAVVVPKDVGDPPTLEELTAHLAETKLTKQFWPERLKVQSALPKTPSGKVQKFVLRQEIAADVAAEAAVTTS